MQMTYDAVGNLLTVTPPARQMHTLSHNAGGLLTQHVAPDAGTGPPVMRFTYDSAGRLVLFSRPDSSVIEIKYSSSGSTQTILLPGGGDTLTAVTDSITGTLTSSTVTGGATQRHTYDGWLRNATSWSGPIAGRLSKVFDTDFRTVTDSVNGTAPIHRTYDLDGLLASAGAITFTRHPQTGFVTATSIGGLTTSSLFSPGPEVSATEAAYAGVTLFGAAYERDSLGRITTKVETVGGVTTALAFVYDSAGHLGTVLQNGTPVEHYDYDANGNRLQATYPSGSIVATTDEQDRLITYGASKYEYTSNGELQYRVKGNDTTSFVYDAIGNLRSVRLPDGRLVEYVVDGDGRRVGKKTDGVISQVWLWDGPIAIVAELNGDGSLVSRFVHGERANVPEYMVRGGATYRLIYDERGSVRLVVDVETGVVAQRLDYDAYGRVLLDTNPGFQPFGFAGGLYDHTTGLVRFGARDYDSEIGRWTTRDPLLFASGEFDLYRYAGNDPVSRSDPTGLCDQCSLVGVLGAAVGISTMTGNFILGRPLTDNVVRNTALTVLGVSLATVTLPTVIIGSFSATQAYAGVAGYAVLNVPKPVWNALVRVGLWDPLNAAWLRFWDLLGAKIVAVSPPTGPSVFVNGTLTGFGNELMWLASWNGLDRVTFLFR